MNFMLLQVHKVSFFLKKKFYIFKYIYSGDFFKKNKILIIRDEKL